jgi:three-Cys-motif partner protein
MSKLDPKLYEGREQTYVKHYVLERYLELLVLKIGRGGGTFNYIDSFAGPWEQRAKDLSDSSPFIALRVLRDAREALRKDGCPELKLRALFVERDKAAHARLETALRNQTEVEARAIQGEFENHIGEAVEFAGHGARPFAFTFIDPCGWDGFALKAIEPLLRVEYSEVLVNLMTEFFSRFADESMEASKDMFGREDYAQRWAGLQGEAREEAIVTTYADCLGEAGRFAHVGTCVVLNPLKDRRLFHLVYATRKLIGLRVFRDVEAKAMVAQDDRRAAAKQRERTMKSGQQELFGAGAIDRPYLDELAERFTQRARAVAVEALSRSGGMKYDDLLALSLSHPMTSEKEVKGWIAAWGKSGALAIEGLAPGRRVPEMGAGHVIRVTGTLA